MVVEELERVQVALILPKSAQGFPKLLSDLSTPIRGTVPIHRPCG